MPDDYRELAAKCRSLAERINDPRTVDVLLKLADEYDGKAAAVDADASGEEADDNGRPVKNDDEGPAPLPE